MKRALIGIFLIFACILAAEVVLTPTYRRDFFILLSVAMVHREEKIEEIAAILRKIFENPVSYASFKEPPFYHVIIGFVSGLSLPLWLRMIPAIWIILAGYWWFFFWDHWIGFYFFANWAYVISCLLGLLIRSRKCHWRVWTLQHADWMAIAGCTVLLYFLWPHR